jgi:hypothetical protein
MTPTAGERKSKKKARARARKAREFFAMRIAYLRQTGFNGKVAFFYVRVSTHFVSRSVFFSSLARSSCAELKSAFFSFFFPSVERREMFSGCWGAAIWQLQQKKERHRCETMDSFLNELLHKHTHARACCSFSSSSSSSTTSVVATRTKHL